MKLFNQGFKAPKTPLELATLVQAHLKSDMMLNPEFDGGDYRMLLPNKFPNFLEAETARVLNKGNIFWLYEPYRLFYTDTDETVQKQEMKGFQPDFYLPEYGIWLELTDTGTGKKNTKLRRLKGDYKVIVMNMQTLPAFSASCGQMKSKELHQWLLALAKEQERMRVETPASKPLNNQLTAKDIPSIACLF